MTSSRPYLIRAMYQWIVDNGMTPYILADTEKKPCIVPTEYIQDGKIVLNIAPMAISSLTLGDDEVTFSARFNGRSHDLIVPVEAVQAIYTRENGQGMMFSDDGDSITETGGDDSDPDPDNPPDKPRPNLKIVK